MGVGLLVLPLAGVAALGSRVGEQAFECDVASAIDAGSEAAFRHARPGGLDIADFPHMPVDYRKIEIGQRIRDKFPAGFVMLKGAFLQQHRDEILHLLRNHEAKEKAEHPLQRIMAIVDSAEGATVTTTDAHLARDLAQALHHAYKGELEFHYNKEDNLLRASWSR